jgi:hypothetical protein
MNRYCKYIIRLRFAALAAVLTLSVSCSREDDSFRDGEIRGYVKSAGYYRGSEFVADDIFGVYIMSAVKDSLLAFDIPASTLNALLGTNIETLTYGDRKISEIRIPVILCYREATETERKSTVPADNGVASGLVQIIVSDIRKARAESGGGSDEIPECCR